MRLQLLPSFPCKTARHFRARPTIRLDHVARGIDIRRTIHLSELHMFHLQTELGSCLELLPPRDAGLGLSRLDLDLCRGRWLCPLAGSCGCAVTLVDGLEFAVDVVALGHSLCSIMPCDRIACEAACLPLHKLLRPPPSCSNSRYAFSFQKRLFAPSISLFSHTMKPP